MLERPVALPQLHYSCSTSDAQSHVLPVHSILAGRWPALVQDGTELTARTEEKAAQAGAVESRAESQLRAAAPSCDGDV